MLVQKLSGLTGILAAHMIRGPTTKFADEGLAITFTFFRITREIFQFGTCQFIIITRSEKAIFRENFSSWHFDSGREIQDY